MWGEEAGGKADRSQQGTHTPRTSLPLDSGPSGARSLPAVPFLSPKPHRACRVGGGRPSLVGHLAMQAAPRVAALVRDCLNISRTERRTLIPDRGANEVVYPWVRSAAAHLGHWIWGLLEGEGGGALRRAR